MTASHLTSFPEIKRPTPNGSFSTTAITTLMPFEEQTRI